MRIYTYPSLFVFIFGFMKASLTNFLSMSTVSCWSVGVAKKRSIMGMKLNEKGIFLQVSSFHIYICHKFQTIRDF